MISSISAPFTVPRRACSTAIRYKSAWRSSANLTDLLRMALNCSSACAKLTKRPVGLPASGAIYRVVRSGIWAIISPSFCLSMRGDSSRSASASLAKFFSSTMTTCSTHSKTDHRSCAGLVLVCASAIPAAAALNSSLLLSRIWAISLVGWIVTRGV